MKKLLSILFLIPLLVRGATATWTGAAISSDGGHFIGWLDPSSGISTNGVFDYGLGAGNSFTGLEKLKVAIDSQGYDDTGTAVVLPIVAVGTYRIRFVTPDWTVPDTIIDSSHGNDVRIKIALSKFVYSGDSNLTAKITAGLYIAGGVTNATVSSLAVTNSSTLTYPKVIANWSEPGWNLVGSTKRIGLIGFHGHARRGREVACVNLFAKDQHSHAVTNRVNQMFINPLSTDKYGKNGEFWTDLDLSSFTEYDMVRHDYEIKPWRGDSTAVFDTRADLFSQPTPFPAAITNRYDPNGTFTRMKAVFEPVSGDDTAGRAVLATDPTTINSSLYFKTEVAAWNSLTASNNLYGGVLHNNPGGGIVYCRTINTTNFNHTGGTLSAGAQTMADVWAKLTTYPGDAMACITNRSNDRNVGHRLWLENIYVAPVSASTPFAGTEAVAFNNCVIDTPSTAWIQTCTNIYVMHTKVPQNAQGFKAMGNQNQRFVLLRDLNLDGMTSQMLFYTAMGIYHSTTNSGFSVADYISTGNGAPPPDYAILYNASLKGLRASSSLSVGGSSDITNGIALVNVLVEQVGNQAFPSASLNSQSLHTSKNSVLKRLTILGERIADMFSNANTESIAVSRLSVFLQQNICDLTGFKKDHDSSPGEPNRFTNLPFYWMVGSGRNMWVECRVNSAVAGFPPDYIGVLSTYPAFTNTIGYVQFVNRKAYAGDGVAAAGNGDYHVQSISPAVTLPHGSDELWGSEYDGEGNRVGADDPPGYLANSSPRKAAGFF